MYMFCVHMCVHGSGSLCIRCVRCVYIFCECMCMCVCEGGGGGYLPFPTLSIATPLLPPTQSTGAIYCDRALRMNGFTGEGVQSGTVFVVKAHSVTPRWITNKKIDFDSKVTHVIIVARCSQPVIPSYIIS